MTNKTTSEITTFPRKVNSQTGTPRGELGLETQSNLPAIGGEPDVRSIPKTPQVTKKLQDSPQKMADHRQKISVIVEDFMRVGAYWLPDTTPKQRASDCAAWMNKLEDWELGKIEWALGQWMDKNPSKKPNPSNINGILRKEWSKVQLQKVRKEQPPQPSGKAGTTTDDRAAISADALARAGLGWNIINIIPERPEGTLEPKSEAEVLEALQDAYTALIAASTALKKRNPQDIYAVELDHISVKMEKVIEKEQGK